MKREARKAQTRQKILEAASELMLTNGFKATSVRDVSKKSKISYVTMYKYFTDKQELEDQVIEKIITDIFQKLISYVTNKTNGSFRHRLTMISEDRTLLDQKYIHSLTEIEEIIEHNPKMQITFNNAIKHLCSIIIQQGKSEGAIKTTVSDAAVTFLLSAILKNRMTLTMEQFEAIAPEVAEIVFYGLVGK
ncbi:TetR/AcrR family transcriptional regulator [Lactobacillus alvi]|uniref:TetR/AcrR family transcriptional regulator n=1 Tax=Limosilactobacillus alvi TaxID=990412 RepID=A0ABS2EMQ7_9LACO|nr:TetR/AcrR family transcriptional regulator [Limosilactobacillus alvi]MBM6753646.1 TetR/AcrR family transcriptional regulator [Limosilactobacillus alvi]